MSQGSGIEWTDATWNPVVGCTRVSAGCDNCYAVTMTHRLERMGQEKYAGLTVLNPRGERHFNGTVRTVPEALEIPLRWRKPRRVFVNSMSDLFHKSVPFEFIAKVFQTMHCCRKHTFQVLTKRADRMAEFLAQCSNAGGLGWITHNGSEPSGYGGNGIVVGNSNEWPLPNVWLGTSCEDQAAADARIPHLLRCPAAVRFLSCEPLLGGIELRLTRMELPKDDRPTWERIAEMVEKPRIDWVIVGGESGAGARACNVEWVRSIVGQCQGAGVACFVKQLGAKPMMDYYEAHEWYEATGFDSLDLKIYTPGYSGALHEWIPERDGQPPTDSVAHIELRNKKGGDMDEWPEDLRVREMPGGSEKGSGIGQ